MFYIMYFNMMMSQGVRRSSVPPSMRAERTSRRAGVEEGGITEGMFRLDEHNFGILDNDFDSNVSDEMKKLYGY
jgi:hypothetical protein